ncbi:MAG: hypothetical protein Q8K71_13935 [Polaromonas sp.]|nr:hypothetical protein [Polaromonas sp.]
MSATDAVITTTQRKAAIGLKLAILQRRMPPGWEGWSHTELIEFRAALAAASRARCHGSLSDLLLAAGRIARAYNEPMALIDPCHGQAS